MIIHAPFTEEQVKALNKWQEGFYVHPFTCICGINLISTKNGWICPECDYTQNWAHDFMADESKHPESKFEKLNERKSFKCLSGECLWCDNGDPNNTGTGWFVLEFRSGRPGRNEVYDLLDTAPGQDLPRDASYEDLEYMIKVTRHWHRIKGNKDDKLR